MAYSSEQTDSVHGSPLFGAACNMERRMMEDWWKARGWAEIAEVLHCSVSTAKRLMTRQGLPLRWEGGQWTLTKDEYLTWHKRLPKYKELRKTA